MAGAMHAIETKTGTQCSHESKKKKKKFLQTVKMLLLQLPSIQKHWLDTHKGSARAFLLRPPLCCTLFDLSADLACPCGQCVSLQDRDIHRPGGRSCALPPIHSTRRNYIFQLSAVGWWKHTGGKRMCGETLSREQSPQTCHHREFHRNNMFKAQSETFDLWALFSAV